MKRGFTLVELSIVLVIIGLLIGGILAGQSMISTAKIQGVVRQLTQYDVAVSNFQARYNQLPGDSNLFPINSSGGTGNNSGNLTDNFYETANVWNHLSLGVGLKNYQNNNYPLTDPYNDLTTQQNCPRFNINQNNIGSPCLTILGLPFVYPPKDAYAYVSVITTLSASGSRFLDSLRPIDALSLDQKMDDGNPNTGKFVGYSFTYSACTIGASPNSTYNVAADNYYCSVFYLFNSLNN